MDSLRKRFSPLVSHTILQYSVTSAKHIIHNWHLITDARLKINNKESFDVLMKHNRIKELSGISLYLNIFTLRDALKADCNMVMIKHIWHCIRDNFSDGTSKRIRFDATGCDYQIILLAIECTDKDIAPYILRELSNGNGLDLLNTNHPTDKYQRSDVTIIYELLHRCLKHRNIGMIRPIIDCMDPKESKYKYEGVLADAMIVIYTHHEPTSDVDELVKELHTAAGYDEQIIHWNMLREILDPNRETYSLQSRRNISYWICKYEIFKKISTVTHVQEYYNRISNIKWKQKFKKMTNAHGFPHI